MGDIVLAGSTSGTVTISPPASAGTTTLTLPSTSGTVTTKDTNGILSVNGVQFPATQSASADANCLDDYEEGTWTPVDGSGASLSFTSVSGTYIKIGRTVTCLFDLTYPSTANGSQAVIGGLPFSGTRGSMITSYSFTLTFVPLGDVGGTGCNLYGKGSNPGSTVLNSDMSTKRILGTIIYITAS